MPIHEKLATMRSTTAKRGLAGAAGGHVEVQPATTGAGSARYDAAILGDAFKDVHNSATAVNEVQRLTPAGVWTSGTFTITFDGQTTAPIPHDATHAQVADALSALSTVRGSVQVKTAESAAIKATPMDVEFVATRGGEDVPQMTTTVTGLVGGGTLTPSTVTAGAA